MECYTSSLLVGFIPLRPQTMVTGRIVSAEAQPTPIGPLPTPAGPLLALTSQLSHPCLKGVIRGVVGMVL